MKGLIEIILKEKTDSIIEKLTKEAFGKMTYEELSEKVQKKSKNIKKDGSTLEEIVFMRLKEQINAMIENFEYKRRCGIGKTEVISKDEAREKIIKMYEKCIDFINLFENKNVIEHKKGEEYRKDLRKQIKKMQMYKNLF